jgi:hypothetical protein
MAVELGLDESGEGDVLLVSIHAGAVPPNKTRDSHRSSGAVTGCSQTTRRGSLRRAQGKRMTVGSDAEVGGEKWKMGSAGGGG